MFHLKKILKNTLSQDLACAAAFKYKNFSNLEDALKWYLSGLQRSNIKVNNVSDDSLKCLFFRSDPIYFKNSNYLHFTSELFILSIQTRYYNCNAVI
jgi:hypothetical protein